MEYLEPFSHMVTSMHTSAPPHGSFLDHCEAEKLSWQEFLQSVRTFPRGEQDGKEIDQVLYFGPSSRYMVFFSRTIFKVRSSW